MCVEINECQEIRELMPSIEMEEVLIASNSKNERQGRNVNLGVEGSNSNGHGRELDKEGKVMKIIKRLQKDAKSCRADRRNLMRVMEPTG